MSPEIIDLTHSEPHFDLFGLCGCECSRCTHVDDGWHQCICPDCDEEKCGLH